MERKNKNLYYDMLVKRCPSEFKIYMEQATDLCKRKKSKRQSYEYLKKIYSPKNVSKVLLLMKAIENENFELFPCMEKCTEVIMNCKQDAL